MTEAKKPGRPREWVFGEEITQIRRMVEELEAKNPRSRWSEVKDMLRVQLERADNVDLLSRFDKLWALMMHTIPLPPNVSVDRETTHTLVTRSKKKNITGRFLHGAETQVAATREDFSHIESFLP